MFRTICYAEAAVQDSVESICTTKPLLDYVRKLADELRSPVLNCRLKKAL